MNMYLIAMFALWSLIAWLVLGWPRQPNAVRTWLPRAFLAASFACFVMATFLQGRYSEDITLFIYPNPYIIRQPGA